MTFHDQGMKTCYSDFAHISGQSTISFVLSLGNDGVDEHKIRNAKQQAKMKAEKAKQRLKEIEAENKKTEDEEEEAPKEQRMTMAQCKRKGCKEFDKKLSEREEKIIDEREHLTELCQQLSEQLHTLDEKAAEAERTNKAMEERGRAIKAEIQRTKELTENMEAEAEKMKKENLEMNHRIMVLELERQKQHFQARQAQEDMVKAMWYKKGQEEAEQKQKLTDLPPLDPIVFRSQESARRLRERKARLPPKGVMKYSSLVRPDLKDSIEVETLGPDSYLTFPRPKTAGPGVLDSVSRLGDGTFGQQSGFLTATGSSLDRSTFGASRRPQSQSTRRQWS